MDPRAALGLHPEAHLAGGSAPATPVDLIVVGSGVAGLSAALAAAHAGASVCLLTAGELMAGSSPRAQGGVAAAVGAGDAPALHAADTVAVGAGLNDRRAVAVLVEEGRRTVRRLLADGVPFDGAPDAPELGLEAGHGRRRILHAGGGATGYILTSALLERVARHRRITVHDHTAATGLLMDGGRVTGVRAGERELRARAVVLASGGYAGVWGRTTNAPESRGAGLMLAWQAGASLADLEFVQFHPTALSLPGRPAFLLTEALRGEGARLVDAAERPFANPLLPRDQLARAIFRHRRDHGPAFLSLRHLDPDFVRGRFPNLAAQLDEWGLDIARDLVPIAPAAHYCMGGLRTDSSGRTDVPGLYAAGEVACTGVQGANRLASNSLLECLVFGGRAALAGLRDEPRARAEWKTGDLPSEAMGSGQWAMGEGPQAAGSGQRAASHRHEVPAGERRGTEDTLWPTRTLGETRDAMTQPTTPPLGERLDRYLGVERDSAGLNALLATLPDAGGRASPVTIPDRVPAMLAALAATAALLRRESRGAHYRADAPDTNPVWRGRIHWRHGHAPRFEEVGE